VSPRAGLDVVTVDYYDKQFKLMRAGLVGHATHVEVRNVVCNVLVGTHQEKKQPGRLRHRWVII
jgi:hypothetical protein